MSKFPIESNIVIWTPTFEILKEVLGELISNGYRADFPASQPWNSYKDQTCIHMHMSDNQGKRVYYSNLIYYKRNFIDVFPSKMFFEVLKDHPIDDFYAYFSILKKSRNMKTMDIDPYGEDDWNNDWLTENYLGYPLKIKPKNMKYKINERKIDYKRKLNPKLFENDKLKDNIREKLLKISNDFYEDLDIEVELLDVWLTGSIANYNYNSESDIDIHLIVDYSEVNDDIELVEKAFDGDRYIWNLRHNIVIQGHDVEIYVQNIKAKHASSGIYSIMNDEWIKKPEYNRPIMDQRDVNERYDERVKEIEKFVVLSKEELTPDEAELYYKASRKLKKKIQKARTDGLNIIGEFSLENLVFKKLRKTGKFGKLINTIIRLYDKIYSQ